MNSKDRQKLMQFLGNHPLGEPFRGTMKTLQDIKLYDVPSLDRFSKFDINSIRFAGQDSKDNLVKALNREPMNKGRYRSPMLCITGPKGSGKSLLAQAFIQTLYNQPGFCTNLDLTNEGEVVRYLESRIRGLEGGEISAPLWIEHKQKKGVRIKLVKSPATANFLSCEAWCIRKPSEHDRYINTRHIDVILTVSDEYQISADLHRRSRMVHLLAATEE